MEKYRRKQESDSGSAALKADALTTRSQRHYNLRGMSTDLVSITLPFLLKGQEGGGRVTGKASSTKTECDYLYGWIKKKKTVTYAKISPRMVKPRDIAGRAQEEEQARDRNVRHFVNSFLSSLILT